METGVNWGDVATWVVGFASCVMGIATIALFVTAFIQINNERMSRIKNGKEIADRKKQRQAELISSWIVKETSDAYGSWLWVAILNQSSQPVYQVIVSIVMLTQTGEKRKDFKDFRVCIDIVPPGQGYTAILVEAWGMFPRAGVEIGFKDAAGRNWVRKADGELSEIQKSTVEYYDIGLPTSWEGLIAELPPNDFEGLETPHA